MNGKMLDGGTIDLEQENTCVCFVADGVGGNKSGDFAAEFVLQTIRSINDFNNIEQVLRGVNHELISFSGRRDDLKGTATTLSGMIVTDDLFRVLHVGDSQIWLRRDFSFFKVTNDQLLSDQEANSPLTSYFGGNDDDLKFDDGIFVREILVGDVFVICSDGLFKSQKHKTVKGTLDGDISLRSKAETMRLACLQEGADDNVSTILIERTE